jgi:hypothetical protein
MTSGNSGVVWGSLEVGFAQIRTSTIVSQWPGLVLDDGNTVFDGDDLAFDKGDLAFDEDDFVFDEVDMMEDWVRGEHARPFIVGILDLSEAIGLDVCCLLSSAASSVLVSS